jgi:23S rRNA (pseudouridine1915-N3)-methyltransferase
VAAWLKLITVGRPKRGPFRELERTYLERIGRYARYERHGIDPSRRRSAGERRREEARAIGRHLGPGPTVVALDAGGRVLDSPGFRDRLCRWRDTGGASLVVGGPDGHASEVLDAAHETIALGPMTLPHELALIVLLEQIYRALADEQGHPYAAH